jgi:hypothetical protein
LPILDTLQKKSLLVNVDILSQIPKDYFGLKSPSKIDLVVMKKLSSGKPQAIKHHWGSPPFMGHKTREMSNTSLNNK